MEEHKHKYISVNPNLVHTQIPKFTNTYSRTYTHLTLHPKCVCYMMKFKTDYAQIINTDLLLYCP